MRFFRRCVRMGRDELPSVLLESLHHTLLRCQFAPEHNTSGIMDVSSAPCLLGLSCSFRSRSKSPTSRRSSRSRAERTLRVSTALAGRNLRAGLLADDCCDTCVLLAARIKKTAKAGSTQTKFKVRCSRYLYTLVVDDAEKAEKLKQSLPPGAFHVAYEVGRRDRAVEGWGLVKSEAWVTAYGHGFLHVRVTSNTAAVWGPKAELGVTSGPEEHCRPLRVAACGNDVLDRRSICSSWRVRSCCGDVCICASDSRLTDHRF